MPYLARTLITRSLELAGIVAANLQTVSGNQSSQGLYLLNALLDWKSAQTDLIPYWTYDTSITAVPGQETYFIPNCVEIETVTFTIGTVRYSIDMTTRENYFGTARVNNISTLPYNAYFNRGNGGGTLYLYFLPAGDYPLQIMGKFALTDVTLDTDLLTYYDPLYIEYLRYGLAAYIADYYQVALPDSSTQTLKAISRQLMDLSPPDLSLRKISILSTRGGINYADVNIGMGYRPQ